MRIGQQPSTHCFDYQTSRPNCCKFVEKQRQIKSGVDEDTLYKILSKLYNELGGIDESRVKSVRHNGEDNLMSQISLDA